MNTAVAAHYDPPEHQRRVDAMQAALRAECARSARPPLFKAPPPRPAPSPDPLDHRIAEEIELIRRHLDALGDVLVGDPVLLHRHGAQLQSIDRMNQILGHVAKLVATQDKAMAVELVSLEELKARLKRKALRLG